MQVCQVYLIPGEDIIKACIEEGIDIVALPGPTASILALVISGLPTGKFVFEGFLPSKKKDRIKELERLKTEERTIILYEAPHRIETLLEDMLNILGDRNISISRELTKIHEETFRGTIVEAIARFKDSKPKGEFVLVLEGGVASEENLYEDISIKEHITKYLKEGLSKKDAVKRVAKERNIPKNEVYKESLDI